MNLPGLLSETTAVDDAPYEFECECGRTHEVSAGAAGTTVACDCGRHPEVPGLQDLRRRAGEPAVSPELLIPVLFEDGRLPPGRRCACCGEVTPHVFNVWVVCERSEVRQGSSFPWPVAFAVFLLSWPLLLLSLLANAVANRSAPERHLGRDVSFCLPLRVCPDCSARLPRHQIRGLLRQVPVYRQLLDKYPHASIT